MATDNTLDIAVINTMGRPVPGIEVRLEGQEVSRRITITDPKGRLTISDLPPGEFVVTVEAAGATTQRRMVQVGPGTGPGKEPETFMLREPEQPYYYRGKVTVPFRRDRRRIGVEVKPSAMEKARKEGDLYEILSGLADRMRARPELEIEALADSGMTVLTYPEDMSDEELRKVLAQVADEEIVERAGVVISFSEVGASFLTAKALVKFADGVGREEAARLAEEAGYELGKSFGTLKNVWRLSTSELADFSLLERINQLAEKPQVVYAEPVLYSSVIEDAFTPTDYLFPEQWDHQIIGTPNAWEMLHNIDVNRTFGSSDIIIAVVDSGVDSTHPEFSGTVTSGASKIYQSFDFVNMVANNNALAGDHGTACASAATAAANNASAVAGVNEGVAGVAGNARLIAIRRGGDEQRYAEMYLWAGGLDPESEDEDFPAVISPGADVITSSIMLASGIGQTISGVMSDVFDALTDQGRGGKGCLMFFSAGNGDPPGTPVDNDTEMERPWGTYNRCFSVSASTLANDGVTETRATYSNFGSQTEFCAPSNRGSVHNPPNNYGAFTAIIQGDPGGATIDATVGRPTNQTTLSSAASSGDTVLDVNSTAGITSGQALMIGIPGQADARSHSVSAVDAGANTVTISPALYQGYASGTAVRTTAKDYQSDFGGTSHATPLCAGIGTLMLSMNPDLTWQQARDIFRETAVKIDPNNTNVNWRWVDEMGRNSGHPDYTGPLFSKAYGYGRVDAAAAVRAAGWRLVIMVADSGEFADVCVGSFADQSITLSNSGVNKLSIIDIASSSGHFLVPSVLSYPIIIEAGTSIEVPIRFQPTSSGEKSATITVTADPIGTRVVDVTGAAMVPRLATLIADAGDFGQACVGSFVDALITLSNSGHCTLSLTDISSNSSEFLAPDVVAYPILIEAGGSLQVSIRFQPASFGAKAADITFASDDPDSPEIVSVSGTAPAPELDLIIANDGNFGNVCIGSMVDKPLTLLNSGACTLTITNIASATGEFIVPNVLTYPIRIAPGTAVEIPLRFEPAGFGPKSGTITVTSDDPTGAKHVVVSANVPSGKLAVTGSTCIGGVKACCVGERTLRLANTGRCPLHVAHVGLVRPSKYWKLINNPFPAILHPGASLDILIRYKAEEKCPRAQGLVIKTDDTECPEKTLDLLAYTVWQEAPAKGCTACGCSECCCDRGCTPQSVDACCFDEDCTVNDAC